jgi:hypothetical protein
MQHPTSILDVVTCSMTEVEASVRVALLLVLCGKLALRG